MTEKTRHNTWEDALIVAQIIAIDPAGFGGVWVKSFASDVRNLWWQYAKSFFETSSCLTVPSNVDDEALLGGIDLVKSLETGQVSYQRGLLDATKLQLMQLSMVERMRPAAVSYITQAFDRPLREFAIIGFDEATNEEPAMPEKFIDRCAFQIRLDQLSYFVCKQTIPEPIKNLEKIRSQYKNIVVNDETLEGIVKSAQALGILSLRAVWYALQAVKALTALRGSDSPNLEDIQTATRLVFIHRIRAFPEDVSAENKQEQENNDSRDNEPSDLENNPSDADQNLSQDMLKEMIIESMKAYLPENLLLELFSTKGKTKLHQQGKSGDTQISFLRGVPLPSRKGIKRSHQKIDFLKTLQAASPWQKLRNDIPTRKMAFRLKPEDIHLKRFQERKTTLTLFVVDASGSSAMERLAEAKGAVELLLADCYVRRDEVSLISFRGKDAAVILPPTRSLLRAKRLLERMPGGGGTPLAMAIHTAHHFLNQLQIKGQTPLLILMTDARANVSMAGIGGREQAFQDAILASRAFSQTGIKSILIDTSIQAQDSAKIIAKELGAKYVALPHGHSTRVIQEVKRLHS